MSPNDYEETHQKHHWVLSKVCFSKMMTPQFCFLIPGPTIEELNDAGTQTEPLPKQKPRNKGVKRKEKRFRLSGKQVLQGGTSSNEPGGKEACALILCLDPVLKKNCWRRAVASLPCGSLELVPP